MRPGRSGILEFRLYSFTKLSANEMSQDLLLNDTQYFPESKGPENTNYIQGLLFYNCALSPLHPRGKTLKDNVRVRAIWV